MATVQYNGGWNGVIAGANGIGCTLSGPRLPANAIIDGVHMTLTISSDKWSSRKQWRLYWYSINGGTPSINNYFVGMSDNWYTFDVWLNYNQSDVADFTSGSFNVHCKANTSMSGHSYLRGSSVIVHYHLPEPKHVLRYYDGTSWKKCIPYYYNGTSWVKCDPYCYNNGWHLGTE